MAFTKHSRTESYDSSSSSPASDKCLAVEKKAPSLDTLPVELLLKIFGLQDNMNQAFALAQSCRRLEAVWKSYRNEIADDIFGTDTYCYELAKLLALEEQKFTQQPHIDEEDWKDIFDIKTLHRHDAMVTNEDDLAYLAHLIINDPHVDRDPTVNDKEEYYHLIPALYYCQLFCLSLHSRPLMEWLEDTVADWTKSEARLVSQMMYELYMHCNDAAPGKIKGLAGTWSAGNLWDALTQMHRVLSTKFEDEVSEVAEEAEDQDTALQS
ncbi:MAG: hypothetical protein M1822_003448 [Bathelium mastoideum]|nr:MAG: hypothetical protein M1822_003448 [Bathelium mastoideum]